MVSEHTKYMVATYARPPPMMVKGEGCYLWDIENRRYLDFTAGIAVNALGHCDPEMAKLIGQQVGMHRLVHNEDELTTLVTGTDIDTHFQPLS